jgi:hypothetical protein
MPLGEVRSWELLTRPPRWLASATLIRLFRLHNLLGTKFVGSTIVTTYSASLWLRSGTRPLSWLTRFHSDYARGLGIKDGRQNLQALNHLAISGHWSLSLGDYSATPLGHLQRSYSQLWVVGFKLGGCRIHILRGCIQISSKRNCRQDPPTLCSKQQEAWRATLSECTFLKSAHH